MPLYYLIALFIGLPIIELAMLFRVHDAIGLGPTILLVLLTGVAGATLVRKQGIEILFKIRHEMAAGNLPAPQMMDGIMVLVAGAFLLTPGLITDAAGFALLIPWVRGHIRAWLRNRLEQKMRSDYMQVNIHRPYE